MRTMKMKITFKDFLLEKVIKPFVTEVKGRGGIPYFEDMPIKDIVYFLNNLDAFQAFEKYDGVSLNVGFDEYGQFFTSRAAKGNATKIYQSTDWGESGASDVFRAAHTVLYKNVDKLKKVLGKNQNVQIEILYGKQPNAIIYGKGGFSYIVFLKAPINEQLDQLKEIFDGVTEKLQAKELTTVDGLNLQYANKMSEWKFIKAREFTTKKIKEIDITSEKTELENYLDESSGVAELTNGELLNTKLTNIKGKDNKALAKSKREEVDIKAREIVNKISEKFLGYLVRSVKPDLQDKGIESPIGIEGIVFEHISETKTFKLVDREEFAKINRFNHKVRDLIKTNVKTENDEAELEDRGGIFGDAKIRIIQLFNIEDLANSKMAKKVLRKFKGETYEETVSNISAELVDSNFHAVKKKAIAILENTQKELQSKLDLFKNEYKTYEIELTSGEKSYYNDEIKNRTLLAFAETFRQLENLKNDLKKVDNFQMMIELFYKNKIEEIHREKK